MSFLLNQNNLLKKKLFQGGKSVIFGTKNKDDECKKNKDDEGKKNRIDKKKVLLSFSFIIYYFFIYILFKSYLEQQIHSNKTLFVNNPIKTQHIINTNINNFDNNTNINNSSIVENIGKDKNQNEKIIPLPEKNNNSNDKKCLFMVKK